MTDSQIFSFFEATNLIRKSRSGLNLDLIDNGTVVVDDFYKLLEDVEKYKLSSLLQKTETKKKRNFIIEVEGLDGSGKTTVVKSLANELTASVALKTPSASLKDIRPLWDHQGGGLARAFYCISNYILEYEIDTSIEEDVVIIDRWFASTLAYSLAWNRTNSISSLPDEIFEWPKDLIMKPNLLLVLDINPEIRKERVERRRTLGDHGSRFNPWDDRLDKDDALGQRIIEIMKRVVGPEVTYSLNANNTASKVIDEALSIIRPMHQKLYTPEEYFAATPLEWWKFESQQMGLCNNVGKRSHLAQWNLQVAMTESKHSPPLLKTVDLDSIDANCIYYWTPTESFRQYSDPSCCYWASVLWMAGDYPLEQQWRAEGYVTRVTPTECQLREYTAPPSLIAHVSACNSIYANTSDTSIPIQPELDDETVQKSRKRLKIDSHNLTSTVCLVRFIPIQIEVLRGGSSTLGYPQRWEWRQSRNESNWTIRSILPLSPTPMPNWKQRGMTIALIGCHTAGKSTIGSLLSKLLDWNFDSELGAILRDEASLVSNGHLHGGGGSTTCDERDSWDNTIYDAECKRDESSIGCCRIVETWHCGNSAWYQLRQGQNVERYYKAIAKHQETSVVLIVHLKFESSSIMIDRRKKYSSAYERLPLEDELKGCNKLFECLQDDVLYESMAKKLQIPILKIDNGTDGEQAMNRSLKEILAFIQIHYKKRVVIS